jgi:hypothetical protein
MTGATTAAAREAMADTTTAAERAAAEKPMPKCAVHSVRCEAHAASRMLVGYVSKSISVLDCVHGMNLLMESADPGIPRYSSPGCTFRHTRRSMHARQYLWAKVVENVLAHCWEMNWLIGAMGSANLGH